MSKYEVRIYDLDTSYREQIVEGENTVQAARNAIANLGNAHSQYTVYVRKLHTADVVKYKFRREYVLVDGEIVEHQVEEGSE